MAGMKPGALYRGELLVACAIALSTPSTADAGPTRAKNRPTLDFFLDIGQNQAANADATVLTPRFAFGLPTSRNIRVKMEWGFTTVSVPSVADDGISINRERVVGLLNPHVAVTYVARADDLRIEMALGMSLPAATADDSNRSAAYLVALGAVGAWDPWLYLPNTLGITLPVTARLDFEYFTLALDAAFFMLIPTTGGGNDRESQFGAEAGLEGYWAIGLFDLGLRLQAVQVGAVGPQDTYLQTSLVPLARLYLQPFILLTEFNFNFDTPHGTTFGDSGTWGFKIGLGVDF